MAYRDDSTAQGWPAATFALVALVVLAVIAGLLVWQPWNTTMHQSTTNVIVRPGDNGQAAGSGSSGTTSSGTTNSGTTNGGTSGSGSSSSGTSH
jgi:uncharacterized membrane protein YgcG